jgi:ketosteroid isomerase-like protein
LGQDEREEGAMPVSRNDAETFFASYAKALASRDAIAIARFWGVPAFVLSDEGAIAVGKPEETEQFFASSMVQYEGIAEVRATIREMHALSDVVIACEIDWAHLDASGKAVGGEHGHYMLRRGDGGLRIHVYTPKAG